MKKHGNAHEEAKRGQIAIEKVDFVLMKILLIMLNKYKKIKEF